MGIVMKFCKQDHGSGENSIKKEKKKKRKRHPTVPTIRWNGQKYFKRVLQYNNVFHQKVKHFHVLNSYINIYNTSEQQIFINL